MLDLIGELVVGQGIAAVVTTHYPPLMSVASRLVVLRDGRLETTVTT